MNDNKPGRPASNDRAREERQLDRSIENSFPASDPSSVTRAPRERRYTAEPPETGADRKTPAKPGPEA